MLGILPYSVSFLRRLLPVAGLSFSDMVTSVTITLQVPPGTVLRTKGALKGEAPVAEVVHDGDRALLMPGGRGGRGNASFKTARNK